MAQGKVYKAIYLALKNWYEPTREGLDLFNRMLTPRQFGFAANLPIIDSRIAINRMLSYYIEQLGRLQPLLAQILFRRFQHQESIKQIAYKLKISEDHLNRGQKTAIIYLVGLIDDEEMRQRADQAEVLEK